MANEKDKKLEKEQELALFENQKIVDVGMEKEVKKYQDGFFGFTK